MECFHAVLVLKKNLASVRITVTLLFFMERIELNAKVRQKATPRKIRRSGYIPAVVYGHNIKTENLEVSSSDFQKIFRKAGESTIVQLKVEGGNDRSVVINEAQKNFLTGKIQHIDFYEVSMHEKMKATVPLEYVGVSKAVKENGGVLLQVLNDVEVECFPTDLPHSIQADISQLDDFNKSLHIKDLRVSDKVKIIADSEEVVAKVLPPRDIEKELQSQLGDVSAVVTETAAPETEQETPAQGEVSQELKENKEPKEQQRETKQKETKRKEKT